ncbi:MAG: hypothetical protein H6750_06575 [Nitrospiraceae bacterium]|nr:hypothetical protein [Nitrospiraceae bacterium]
MARMPLAAFFNRPILGMLRKSCQWYRVGTQSGMGRQAYLVPDRSMRA